MKKEKLWSGMWDHIPTFPVINKDKIFLIPRIRLSCFVDRAIFWGSGPLASTDVAGNLHF